MLPIPVPKQFFKQLNLYITQFIWRNKPPRIKMTILQNPLEKGGLKVPNFERFYWAAQIRAIWVWQIEQVHSPKWKQIEQNHLTELKLESVPYISSLSSLLVATANPVIVHTYKTWQQIRKKMSCIQTIYNKSPFHFNPSLPKALRDWYYKPMGYKRYYNFWEFV